MKNRLLSIIVAAAFMGGCVKTVYVPYAVCPKPPEILKTELLTDKIRPTDPVDQILKGYVADIVTLRGDLAACITIVKGYGSFPATTPPKATPEQ